MKIKIIFLIILLLSALILFIYGRGKEDTITITYENYTFNLKKIWAVEESKEIEMDSQRGRLGQLILSDKKVKVSFRLADNKPKISNAFQPMLYDIEEPYKSFAIPSIKDAIIYCKLINGIISTQCKIVKSEMIKIGIKSYFTDWYGRIFEFNNSEILIYSPNHDLLEEDIISAVELIERVIHATKN